MRKKIYIALLTLCMSLTLSGMTVGATFVDDGYGQFGGGSDKPAPSQDPAPAPPTVPTQPTQQPTQPSSSYTGKGGGKKKTTVSYEEAEIIKLDKNQNLTLTVYYKNINDFYVTAEDKKITFPKQAEDFTASAYYTDQKDGKLVKDEVFPYLPDSAAVHLTKEEKEQDFKKADISAGTAKEGEKYDVKTYVIENASAGTYKLFYKKDALCSVNATVQDIFIVSLLNEEKPVISQEDTPEDEQSTEDSEKTQEEDKEKEESDKKDDSEKEDGKEENAAENETAPSETPQKEEATTLEFAYLTIDSTDKDVQFVTNADTGDVWYKEIAIDSFEEDKENSIFHINMYADINAPLMLLRGSDKKDCKAAITKTRPVTCNIQISESAITEDTLKFIVNIETTTDGTFLYDVLQNDDSIKNGSISSNAGPSEISIPLSLKPGKYEFKLHLYTENPAFEDKVMDDTVLATYEKTEEVVSENTVSEDTTPKPTPQPETEPEPEPFQMDNQTRLMITAASYGANLIVYLIIFLVIKKIRKRKEEE